jgi:hypothetical protein
VYLCVLALVCVCVCVQGDAAVMSVLCISKLSLLVKNISLRLTDLTSVAITTESKVIDLRL